MDDLTKFRAQLEKSTQWPSVYMFKMIIPANNRLYAMIRSCFPDEASITEKQSSKGNYISVTATELMLDADEVIRRYQQLSVIEGIVLL